jgi:apolipoprotein N-acyltransferase
LLSFLLAVPAYRLHQHIAFGAGLGEWQAFGAWAFARGFALWWAAWALGVLVCAGVLRALIETVSALAAWRAPALALPVRLGLERAGLVLLYLGLPAWLAWRALG